ncbi:MAG: class I SAM-dependent methyltransferase [Candidatus Woesearchaeota archaeon]
MKRIKIDRIRYGEEEFDKDYINWGFHDKKTQHKEAQSVINLINSENSLQILDIGCGIGTHAIYWAELGHEVVGMDISNTFIKKAKKTAKQKNVSVNFLASTIDDLDYEKEFDLIVSIEFFPDKPRWLTKIYNMLDENGKFIFDLRNPYHREAKKKFKNIRTWKEKDGIFYLERHERNLNKNIQEDVWITIDTKKELIIEKTMESNLTTNKLHLFNNTEILNKAGFNNINFKTMEGDLFTNGEEPLWLWCVATK